MSSLPTLQGMFKSVTMYLIFRYVFTVKDLDIACPAYQHFRECLNQLEELADDIQFRVTLMDEFPQSFQYTRTKQLVGYKY